MKLDDLANQVRIQSHQGPHPREYHEEVFQRITSATQGCRGKAQCRAALMEELSKIAKELSTAGTRLRKLVTKIAEE
jgi:methyl-accepting chemotaxis protein